MVTMVSTKRFGLWMVIASLCAVVGIRGEEDRATGKTQSFKILSVEIIYVDELNGGEGSQQIRDMLIGSLQRAGRFMITENSEKADAMMRGSAEDLVFSEVFRGREGINVRGGNASSRRDPNESSFDSATFGVGDSEDTYRRERKHEAVAAIRLVLRNGEVIWSTTQESRGAKYRGSAADVAEKVAKELLGAVQTAEKAQRLEARREALSGNP